MKTFLLASASLVILTVLGILADAPAASPCPDAQNYFWALIAILCSAGTGYLIGRAHHR
jgi:hypothetical protein